MAATPTTQIGGDNRIGPNLYLATANPTADNDATTGIHLGDRVINTTSGTEFLCLSNAAGAANWKSAVMLVRPAEFVVSAAATGGNGTVGSPWTGWKAAHDDYIAAGGKIVYFPAGFYSVSSTLDWTASRISVRGDRNATVLIVTGSTGACAQLSSTSGDNAVMPFNWSIKDLIIDGNDTMPTGLLIKHAHNGHIDNVTIYGVTQYGFRTQWAVCNAITRLRITTHGAHRTASGITMPSIAGADFGESSPGYQTTAGLVRDMYVAHVPGKGIIFSSANTMTFVGGAVELIGDSAIYLDGKTHGCRFMGVDIEVTNQTVAGYSVEMAGTYCVMTDAYVEGKIKITGAYCGIQGLQGGSEIENTGFGTWAYGNNANLVRSGNAALPIVNWTASAAAEWFNVPQLVRGSLVTVVNTGARIARGFTSQATANTSPTVFEDEVGQILHARAPAAGASRQAGHTFRNSSLSNRLTIDRDGAEFVTLDRQTIRGHVRDNIKPVAHWRCSDKAGSTTLRDVIAGRHATIDSGTTLGVTGLAFEDGANCITLASGDSATLAYSSALNVSTLFCAATIRTNASGANQTIFCRDDQGSNRVFQLYVTAAGYLEMAVLASGTTYVTVIASPAVVNDGKVHHVAFSWAPGPVDLTTGNGGAILYVDGVPVNAGAVNASAVLNAPASLALRIGKGISGTYPLPFSGQIQDAVFGTSATPTQVGRLADLILKGE